MTADRARPVTSLVLLLVVPAILGALLAPQVYNLLAWLGQHVDLGPHLSNPKFKRVLSRCVLVIAVLLFYPAVRLSGVTSFRDLGWSRDPRRWRTIAAWYLAGAVLMAAIYVGCDLAGAFHFKPRSTELGHMLAKWGALLTGSLFIGIFEETFFRGYVFGVFRTRLNFWAAAVAASAIFALVHLARPAAPEGLDPTHWLAGIRMLPHITDGVDARYLAPSMTNLFLMGTLFCILYRRAGNIYPAIGLHGGWVLAMGIGTYLFDRSGDRLGAWLGPSETIAMTWLGTAVVAICIAAALTIPIRKAENVGAT
jgi:membrane protease YdiL (CAAX protease family)